MKTKTMLYGTRALGVLLLLILLSVFAQNTLTASASAPVFLMKWGGLAAGNSNGEFNNPRSVAIDSLGNVYVADSSNQRIQKFDNFGNFIKTWGTPGNLDGQFNEPRGIGFNGDGNLYVADSGNNRIQVFDTEGNFVRKWGTSGSGNNQFNFPRGVCFDASNNVYVADWNNSRMIEFTSDGTFIRKWGTFGSGNSQFKAPHGCVIDSDNHIYVVEQDNHRVQKFDLTKTPPMFDLKWGSKGNGNGEFDQPHGILLDSGNHIQVADTLNHRIQEFNKNGAFVRTWGTEGTDAGQFKEPRDLEEDANGNFFVADTKNNRIQKFGTKYNPGICDVTQLINAIYVANNTAGADTLELDGTCTYTLTTVNNTDATLGPNGLPVITSNITFNGNGATIARDGAAPQFRLLQIASGATLTLNQLTLTGGAALDGTIDWDNIPGYSGGAIYNLGNLHIVNSTVSQNVAGRGGQLDAPWATDGGSGGGIYSAGSLYVDHSIIANNSAGAGGSSVSTIAGDKESVYEPTQAHGAGSGGSGGAIFSSGTLEIIYSTISDNTAGNGGGCYGGTPCGAGGSGGGIYNSGTLNLTANTMTGNASGLGGVGQWGPGPDGTGGGIFNNGTAVIANTTLAENSSPDSNGRGGGIYSEGSTQIINSTIAENTANEGSNVFRDGNNVTFTNTISANGGCNAALTDGGNNLDSSGSCGVGAATDPMLDPDGLKDNGGPTQTIALQNGSPALDAGNDTVCAAAPVNGVDQRGVTRPQGAHCDIGAFEKELLTQTIEDNNTTVQYNGWEGEENSSASGGTYRESNTKNDTVTFKFTGKKVTWLARKGPDMGKARVTIDGVSKGIVDLYSPTEEWLPVKTFGKLANAKHTLVIHVLGTKNALSTDTTIGVDAFQVGGAVTEENANAVKFTKWAGKANGSASGGSYRSSANAKATMRFTFDGDEITWLTAKGPKYGKARVLIHTGDQVVDKGVFDLYAKKEAWPYTYSFTALGTGTHTIEIQVLGIKNTKSAGNTVIVDAFRGPFQ